ncbi:MAG: tail-specific protease [Bacteroidetes bacterium]|nr:MAG: tail-specific protease [Bacteroidota bacterium]
MFTKKTRPVILVFLVAAIFFAFQTLGSGNPPTKHEKILREVGEMLEQGHYSPKKIDDNFSKDIFKKYLEALDPEKKTALRSDSLELVKYQTTIDDEIHGAPIQFFPAVEKIYTKRNAEIPAIYNEILSKPFDFTVDESIVVDKDKLAWPASEDERKEVWRKRLKYLALQRYSDLLDEREKSKGKEGFVAKSDADLEKEARSKVKLMMDREFERNKKTFNEEERFSLFVNTITGTMDPHTTFFPPVEKRSFDEFMSGRFYGIGASLRLDDGNIKIATIMNGSPAYKSGQLEVGDIITKVGQGAADPEDLTGFDVEDAVKLIRGNKGTEVKLTLKKADGTNKVVSLIRDEIVLDETFAKSAIVNEGSRKIGYISLPDFYADWERPNGARCAEDVAKEIEKLKAQKVDGIVLDLRNNGGGSLYDVIQMVGLFIQDGPVVQVRDREGVPTVLKDRDKSVLYNGPFTVLVNELSASASEIFAAAIQDYKRGIIIGSQTYGKGTVQRNISLDNFGQGAPVASSTEDAGGGLGTVKLTLQKFYRINGGSTQLRGVTPDIIIPDRYDYLEFREKDNPDALKWDEIQKANYTPWTSDVSIPTVKSTEDDRIKTNKNFEEIKKSTELLAKLNDKEYSLNLKKFQAEQKEIRSIFKQLESVSKLEKEMNVELLDSDSNKYALDKAKQDRQQQWLKNLKSDIYLSESVNVLNDMISQANVAKSN